MVRVFASSGDFHVAVFMSHDAALLAWNFDARPAAFAGVEIRRRREDTGEETVLSEGQLIQRFCYGDYTVPPARISYTVTCFGADNKPVLHRVELRGLGVVDAFAELSHSVWFNRGVAGSQRYAKNFPGDELTQEKLSWLGKGLDVALVRFCALALDSRFELHVCAYELTLILFLESLKSAIARGVRVRVIYDCKSSGGKLKETSLEAKAALDSVHFPPECLIARTQSSSAISHNKFIVLSRDGVPEKLWTGSVNFTSGGVYGQLNAAHVISDLNLSNQFKKYWELLSTDPTPAKLKLEVEKLSPLPSELKSKDCVAIFSPRSNSNLLHIQAAIADSAKSSSFLTAAFGINPLLQSVMEKKNGIERFLLLESTDKLDLNFQNLPHLKDRIAVGSFLGKKTADILELTEEELTGLNKHVKFVHTKLLLADMFCPCPILVFGSGNFSEASVEKNDENQIIIRGDANLADQILVHLFRIFFHFLWRKRLESEPPEKNFFLKKRNENWFAKYFVSDSEKFRQRELMCPVRREEIAEEPKNLVLNIEQYAGAAVKMIGAKKKEKKEVVARAIEKTEDGKFAVTFSYDAELVEKLKIEICSEERQFDNLKKRWLVNASSEEALRVFASEHGFTFL
jgi:hypothetical protein